VPVDRISDGAWRIRLPLPWNLRSVNAFLFRLADGWLLLDCGLNTDATFEAFEAAFEEIGAQWGDVRRIVASHMHPDHFGGAARARRLSSAPVALPPIEAKLVAPPLESVEFFSRPASHLLRHGAPEADVEQIRQAASEVAAAMDRFVPDEAIDNGDVIEFDGGRLEAVHTPGHTPGLLCFYDPDNKVLYSTDMILQRITPHVGVHWFYEDNPLGDYLTSLSKLESLDCELVVPSHGPPFTGLQRRIAETRSHQRRRAEKILAAVAEGEASAYEIAGRVWGTDAPPQDRRFAAAEALAHLEYMARTFRVARRDSGGVIVWRSI